MDTATGDIRAVEFTSSDKGDSPVLPHLLDQFHADEQIGTVTGDDGGRTAQPPRPATRSSWLRNTWGGQPGNAGPDITPEVG